MQNGAVLSVFAERPVPGAAAMLRESAHDEAIRLGAVSIDYLRPGLTSPGVRECQFLFQLTRSALGSARGKPFRLDSGTWMVGMAGTIQMETMPGGLTLSLRIPLDLLSR